MAQKDKILKRAQKFVQKGAYEKAVVEYRSAIDLDSGDVSLRLRLGDLFVKTGQLEEAVKEYTSAAKSNARRGFYLKAIAVYKRVLTIEKSSTDTHYKLAELYTKQRLIADAMSQYTIILNTFEQKGMDNEELDILQKMVHLDPSNLSIKLKLAAMYRKLDFIDDAFAMYRLVCGKLFEAGNFKKAEDIYMELYGHYPEDQRVLTGLMDIYREKGDDEGLHLYASKLMRHYVQAGELDEAMEVSKEILAIRPDDGESLSFLESYGSEAVPETLPEADVEAVEEVLSVDEAVTVDDTVVSVPDAEEVSVEETSEDETSEDETHVEDTSVEEEAPVEEASVEEEDFGISLEGFDEEASGDGEAGEAEESSEPRGIEESAESVEEYVSLEISGLTEHGRDESFEPLSSGEEPEEGEPHDADDEPSIREETGEEPEIAAESDGLEAPPVEDEAMSMVGTSSDETLLEDESSEERQPSDTTLPEESPLEEEGTEEDTPEAEAEAEAEADIDFIEEGFGIEFVLPEDSGRDVASIMELKPTEEARPAEVSDGEEEEAAEAEVNAEAEDFLETLYSEGHDKEGEEVVQAGDVESVHEESELSEDETAAGFLNEVAGDVEGSFEDEESSDEPQADEYIEEIDLEGELTTPQSIEGEEDSDVEQGDEDETNPLIEAEAPLEEGPAEVERGEIEASEEFEAVEELEAAPEESAGEEETFVEEAAVESEPPEVLETEDSPLEEEAFVEEEAAPESEAPEVLETEDSPLEEEAFVEEEAAPESEAPEFVEAADSPVGEDILAEEEAAPESEALNEEIPEEYEDADVLERFDEFIEKEEPSAQAESRVEEESTLDAEALEEEESFAPESETPQYTEAFDEDEGAEGLEVLEELEPLETPDDEEAAGELEPAGKDDIPVELETSENIPLEDDASFDIEPVENNEEETPFDIKLIDEGEPAATAEVVGVQEAPTEEETLSEDGALQEVETSEAVDVQETSHEAATHDAEDALQESEVPPALDEEDITALEPDVSEAFEGQEVSHEAATLEHENTATETETPEAFDVQETSPEADTLEADTTLQETETSEAFDGDEGSEELEALEELEPLETSEEEEAAGELEPAGKEEVLVESETTEGAPLEDDTSFDIEPVENSEEEAPFDIQPIDEEEPAATAEAFDDFEAPLEEETLSEDGALQESEPSEDFDDFEAPLEEETSGQESALHELETPEGLEGDDEALETEEQLEIYTEPELEEAIQNLARSSAAGDVYETYEELKTGFEKQLSTEDAGTHFNLGKEYLEMELFKEASREFKIALKDKGLGLDCYINLAACSVADANYEEAIIYYLKVLKAFNGSDDRRKGFLYDLATAYGASGQESEAQGIFSSIYESDPRFRDVAKVIKKSGAVRSLIPLNDSLIEVELL